MLSESKSKGQNLRELLEALNRHLPQLGYQPSSIARLNADWNKLIKYADAHGVTNFSMELGRAFVWERYGAKLGDKDAAHTINRAIHMLADFEQFGMVFKQSSMTLKGFSQNYKPVFEGFLKHLRKMGWAEGSIRTWRSRLFRFEYFLLQKGVAGFDEIGSDLILTYVQSLSCFSSGVISATLSTLRKLFDYAIVNDYHEVNLINRIPPVRKIQKYRLPNVFTPEEVERVLAVVNRDDPLGKRDYAVLLLAAKLGLRVSDVRGLRFCNLDWQNKIISIVQRKTGAPLELPLLEDVGWAIIDYLRNGRPESDCDFIFIRHCAPFEQITDSFQRSVVKYFRKAGVSVHPDKPIGMHTFRHNIATVLLKNGAAYTEIAQTLGHAAPESAQQYISLDAEQLRQCALEVCF